MKKGVFFSVSQALFVNLCVCVSVCVFSTCGFRRDCISACVGVGLFLLASVWVSLCVCVLRVGVFLCVYVSVWFAVCFGVGLGRLSVKASAFVCVSWCESWSLGCDFWREGVGLVVCTCVWWHVYVLVCFGARCCILGRRCSNFVCVRMLYLSLHRLVFAPVFHACVRIELLFS